MATYYVRPDGNNSNAGTGPATNQAWQTLARIVQAGTAFTSGDTVYIAPGTYRQSITTTATYTSATNFFGDPTAAQFLDITPGIVRITNFISSDNLAATSTLLWGGVTFDYINISHIYFDHTSLNGGIYYTGTGNNSSIKNCVFSGNQAAGGGVGTPAIRLTSVKNLLIDNCIFMRSYYGIFMTTTTDNDTNIDIRNSFFANNNGGLWLQNGVGGGINVTNNLFSGSQANGVFIQNAGNATAISNVTNNIFYGCVGSVSGGSAINIVENYNRRVGSGGNTTVLTGANTITDGAPQFDFGHTSLFGLAVQKPFSAFTGSVNSGAGLATYASTSDLYGQTWSGGAGVPDIGCATAVQASGTSYYYPTERNASTITIAPGSTSQSIELYLGATGLTASTSGLSAYYNRTRTASVNIPLVARTIAQAWTSGGFAEVDATNMPGVYRLDLPDAALAAGADDVTIVVRGASGTNGAVMTVKLSSGGLTSAQTAAAVWDEPYTSHTTASTFGARTLLTTADNRPAAVGTSNHIQANVHAIVDSTVAADELSGALLHNGTDYISAELLTPVSAATSVHIGPYQLLADGLGADQPLDVNVGTATSIDVQVTDANGTGIDITSATVSAKVYNSGGTLVATYAGTATYADNGRLSFGLTTTVTATSGTYTVTVTRTTGATDTQIFGPLRLYVRPV
jgi:hypothetical protein